MREIGHDLMHALVHVDRSVLSLVRMLLVRPGEVAKDYVAGRRRRYFGPFAFLVIAVALASAVMALSGFRAFTSDGPNAVADFLQRHVNVVILFQVPLLAAFCAVLFRKDRLNFAEHLVLAAYASGMRSLFLVLVVVPYWYESRFSHAPILPFYYAFLCIWFAYFGFSASQFYEGSRAAAWLKGVLASILAQAAAQGIVSLITYVFFEYTARG
jgi:Protein of unknown function (DUF3667)